MRACILFMDTTSTHILIVDDDPQVHKLLAKMLPSPKYRIASAFNASEAFAAIAAQTPQLIVLDIMMPKVSGIEVCNYVKGTPELQDILILILSAKDAPSPDV